MDLKFAIRSFLKNPAFTVLAITVMALGIGANTAVFSAVNAVLLKPLQYPEADRIVQVSSLWRKIALHSTVSAPDFHDWHDESKSFSAMAYYSANEAAVKPGKEAIYARIATVTPEFLDVFALQPAIGRWFSAEEAKPGSAAAVLISNTFWQNNYSGDPGVIGKTLRIFDRSLPIVGVMPPRFSAPDESDIWFPANTIFPETASRSAHNYQVLARLKPGVTVEQANAEMTTIGNRLEKAYPSSNDAKNRRCRVDARRDGR